MSSPRRARNYSAIPRDSPEPEIQPLEVEAGPVPLNDDIDVLATALLFLFPALGGLLFGYDIGATSGALLSIMSPQYSGTDWYRINLLEQGLVVSLSLAGAVVGSLVALVWGDRLGRRRELQLAALLYGMGALGMFVIPSQTVWFVSSVLLLLISRGLYGIGIGFAMHAAPAYIAETAPPKVRGLLISLKECFIVGGILLGYLVSYLFVEQAGGWRMIYGMAAAPAVLLWIGMLFMPESPRWLLLNGAGREAAAAALRQAKGSKTSEEEIEAEIMQMSAAVATASSSPKSGTNLTRVLEERYQRPLFVGLSLMLFQQITGQPSVLYYAAQIFQNAGFSGAGEAAAVSVVLGLFKLVMTGIAVASVDSWGRRPLLLVGVSGLTFALLVLGVSQALLGGADPGSASQVLTWTNVLALLLYVGCYQVSFGPISWLIVGEVFPLAVRGEAIALATITNFTSNFLVSLVLPTLEGTVGLSNTYFMFALIATVAVVSIYYTVPETKGKTLEEIEAMWGDESKRS